MTLAASRLDQSGDLVASARTAATAAQAVLADATIAVRARVMHDGRVSARAMDREQRATHGLAWLATPSDKPDHRYDPDTYYIEEK